MNTCVSQKTGNFLPSSYLIFKANPVLWIRIQSVILQFTGNVEFGKCRPLSEQSGPVNEEVIEGWRNLQNDLFYNSHSFVSLIKGGKKMGGRDKRSLYFLREK
jgi:hypothetical protein